jgi:hypothetical protein
MTLRAALRALAVVLGLSLTPSDAAAFIHFPPMTLPKMCEDAHVIRVLKVEKFDKDKGVIIFETAEFLKKVRPPLGKVKHVLPADAADLKPLRHALTTGKQAVMFTLEAKPGPNGNDGGCGYVFIDEFCYSIDYNHRGEYWLVMRAEPAMSAFFHGKVEELRKAVQATLAGKEVKVPTKETTAKGTDKDRHDQINELMIKNRK